MFDVAATGDQSGGLNQSGTVIGARFAPNPHRGDAIIATFFWLGSSTIDSVTDFLTDANSTPVHNTYRLVESASAGGISMATYVALNVQNFPDPSDPPTSVGLAVRANLHTAVTDGGVLLSAWSGVQGISTQHRSASGAGSAPTVAAPGAITLGAGDLAYAVTMSNAVVGRNGSPQGFTNLAVQSDPYIADQADYLASASGGTADPRWTWNFTQQSTWLATVLALTMTAAPPPPPGSSGNLTASAATTGSSLDPDGYTVTVDQTASQPIASNGGSVTFTGLATGSHSVALSGVAPNCTVSGGNAQTVTVPSGGTATVSFSATCTTAAPGGAITLDTHIGTANQQNLNILIKGFDNGNPRRGDAIIATFFWVTSTPDNIIESVTDVVNDATFTPVGNTYHLVRFVHSGNVSAATYVATNVQNFPDPTATPHLAVRANLRETVADGGLQLSAWSGVASDFTQAMGASNAASGSGTAYTADPGAIDIGAGALAYGVSLVSNNGLADAAPPPEFTILNVLSDASVIDEANYLVSASARSVQPQWRWQFSQPSTWLATALALNPATGSSVGSLTATTNTTGSSLDPDGYTVTVDGGAPQALGINASFTYTNLAAGSHTVAISGVAANCTVSGGPSQTVSVPAGGTVTAPFTLTCSATTGNLTATTSTTGSSLDPDGYTVTVDGGSAQALGINASFTYTNLSAGNHTVAIAGVASNCTVSGGTSRTVSVPSGGTATTTFSVGCVTPPGNLTATTSTTGSSLDPDGYTVTLDGGSAQALGINTSFTYTNLSAGNHTVAIAGVAGNCTVSGGTSRTVSVPSGGTASTTFTVTCVTPNQAPVVNAGPDEHALTGLLYSTSFSFSDANNNGPWSYTINWGDGTTSTGTRTAQGTFSVGHTYVIILPRNFTITVTVRDAAGASGSDSKVVSVTLL